MILDLENVAHGIVLTKNVLMMMVAEDIAHVQTEHCVIRTLKIAWHVLTTAHIKIVMREMNVVRHAVAQVKVKHVLISNVYLVCHIKIAILWDKYVLTKNVYLVRQIQIVLISEKNAAVEHVYITEI